MADNNERSRADDLFEILNEFNDDNDSLAKKSVPQDDNLTPKEESVSESHVDEILEILSRGQSEENYEESTIPTSIFSHLSDSEASQPQTTQPAEGEMPHFSSHFTADDGSYPTPPEPIEEPIEENEPEEDDDDDGYEEEKTTKLGMVGKVLQSVSVVPKALVYILLLLVVSAFLSYYIINIGNDIFAFVADTREVTITIEEGATHETVANILEENGVINYPWVFELYMTYRGDGDAENEYIIGEHKLNTNYNYSQIITALTSKTVKREIVRVTIPEGYTIDQIIDLLIEKGVGQREDYIEAINNYPYKWEFVQLLEERGYPETRKYRLEGYLYPDTYEFYTTENEVYVINKMLSAFNEKFWKDFTQENSEGVTYRQMMLDQYGLDFDDVIVLASMVQSEGGTVDDFYAISYVFHNRLSHSSSFPKLESDATIQYVLPERITDSTQLDKYYETPYNTYLYDGLPPGAISSPGRDALSAALFPSAPKTESGKEINAYFFVSNDAGKTYYASTSGGHEQNVVQAKKDNEAIKNGTYDE